MKLKHKITLSTLTVSILIVIFISLTYREISSDLSQKKTFKNLLSHAIDASHHVDIELQKNVSSTKILASTPVVENFLVRSNNYYNGLPEKKVEVEISRLNSKWLKLREDESDPFISKYLTNDLALFLKKQQDIIPAKI